MQTVSETFSTDKDVLSDQSVLRLHLVLDKIGSMPYRSRESRVADSLDLSNLLIKSLRFSILGCGFRRNGTDCLRRLVDLESCVDQKEISKYAHKFNSVVCVLKAILDSHDETDEIVIPEPIFATNNHGILSPQQILFVKTKMVDYLVWLRKSSLVKHNDVDCSSDYESLINRLLSMATIAHISRCSSIFLDFIEITNLELCYDTKNPERSLANWGVFRGLFIAHSRWCAPYLSLSSDSTNGINAQSSTGENNGSGVNSSQMFNDMIEQLFIQFQQNQQQ